MDTPAHDLSGGEKARLLLGLATFAGANLLILDEPTNHLDIDSREALVQALAEFSGAVILISHDRHLIEASVDRLWLVAGGTVRPYDGDLDEYRRLVLDGPASGRRRIRRQTGQSPDQQTARDGAEQRRAMPRRFAGSRKPRRDRKAQKEIARNRREARRSDALCAQSDRRRLPRQGARRRGAEARCGGGRVARALGRTTSGRREAETSAGYLPLPAAAFDLLPVGCLRGRGFRRCPGSPRLVDRLGVVAVEEHDDPLIAGSVRRGSAPSPETHRGAVGIVESPVSATPAAPRHRRPWPCRAAGSLRRDRSRDARRSPSRRSSDPTCTTVRQPRSRHFSSSSGSTRSSGWRRGGRTELVRHLLAIPRLARCVPLG